MLRYTSPFLFEGDRNGNLLLKLHIKRIIYTLALVMY